MAYAQSRVLTATEVAHGRIFDHKGVVFTACRAFTMISGGFLFGSGISDNSLWGSILGTAVGIAAFAFNEVIIRRTEQ
jgi:hypothetical protein